MSDKIEIGKQYRTRDGREVRIYAVDGSGYTAVHGATKEPHGWHLATWTASGAWGEQPREMNQPMDLIEVKRRVTRTYWLAHSPNFTDATQADVHQMNPDLRAATFPQAIAFTGPYTVEFEEGEGL